MPKNCSSDVQAVISHIDKVFTFGPKSEITKIKATFGLQNLTHLDDVAGARESILLVDDMRRLTICEQFATTCGIGSRCNPRAGRVLSSSPSAMPWKSRMADRLLHQVGVWIMHSQPGVPISRMCISRNVCGIALSNRL